MPRLLACLLVAALLTGCYHAPAQPMQNPFVGQTTVPPPGTGTSQTLAPPPSSYYQPPANVPYVAPPQTATPGPMSPNPSYAPPGTYGAPQGYPQSSYVRPQPYVAGTVDRAAGQRVTNDQGWRVPAPATRAIGTGSPTVVARPSSGVGLEEFSTTSRPATSHPAYEAPASGTTPTVRSEGYVQHIEPRHGEPIRIIEPARTMPESRPSVQQASVRPATPTPPAEPARFQPRGNLVDITDLPEPRRNNEVQQAVYRAQEPAPRRSVYAVASRPTETWSRDEVDVDTRYDVDLEYRWLRGRLVHDEAADQWRLDYVAPGEAVDEFGGSVVLHDAALLENFRSGDYVLVHGVLDDESIELDAPPWYHVEQIVRTAD